MKLYKFEQNMYLLLSFHCPSSCYQPVTAVLCTFGFIKQLLCVHTVLRSVVSFILP